MLETTDPGGFQFTGQELSSTPYHGPSSPLENKDTESVESRQVPWADNGQKPVGSTSSTQGGFEEGESMKGS